MPIESSWVPILNGTKPAWPPLFALRYGYQPYYSPSEGPVLNMIYGPLAFLSYFPSLVAHAPVPAVLVGCLVASLYFFSPVCWLCLFGKASWRRRDFANGLLLFSVFGLATLSSKPLRYAAFNIHADAPALGFGALACGAAGISRQEFVQFLACALRAFRCVFGFQQTELFLPHSGDRWLSVDHRWCGVLVATWCMGGCLVGYGVCYFCCDILMAGPVFQYVCLSIPPSFRI